MRANWLWAAGLTSVVVLASVLAGQTATKPNSIELFRPGTLRALILSGRNNHDWRTTTPFIRKLLLASNRFDVRVNEEPAGMTADTLAAYQVVVLDYNGPRWGSAAEDGLRDFVQNGNGLVVVHGASWAFNGLPVLGDHHVPTKIIEAPWSEYRRMIGGVWSAEAPATGHSLRHQFRVKFTDNEHPITKALGAGFIADDELYHHMRMQPDAQILATAYDDPNIKAPWGAVGTGKDEPILWTVAYGKGRVFHTTLGHDVAAMQVAGFVATLLRGTEWAASASVTLPPEPLPAEAVAWFR